MKTTVIEQQQSREYGIFLATDKLYRWTRTQNPETVPHRTVSTKTQRQLSGENGTKTIGTSIAAKNKSTKENLLSMPALCTKIISTWITHPNLKPGSIKHLEKIGNQFDLGLGKDFLNRAPKSQSIKDINKLISSKLRMK